MFTYYIAEGQRSEFLAFLSSHVHFFSFLMDGSTDAGNLEQEVVFINYSIRDDIAKEIHLSTPYFAILNI